MDPITLSVLASSLTGVAEEMSAALVRTAYSPNIKERRDCSSAVFDVQGNMVAQAENIPVHLGAMPFSVQAVVQAYADWTPGDVALVNDPYRGGAHLPDITCVAPVFHDGRPLAYVAVRAHHADVGGMTPGSLPAAAQEIFQEGLVLPPVKLWRAGKLDEDLMRLILANVRTPRERRGDLRAQLAAVHTGTQRMEELADRHGACELLQGFSALMDHAERRMKAALCSLPSGSWAFTDSLDEGILVSARLLRRNEAVTVDFTGSSPQVMAPVNAPFAVTASAVYFALRAALDPGLPPNAGAWRPVHIVAPPGTVVHARWPAAVGGGNLELSQRIVDVMLGALAQALPDRVPAACQGTMNNLTIGGIDPRSGEPYTFYETLGGGFGGRPDRRGIDGVHSHMTNTLNTPVEALEVAYPLRVEWYGFREGSGGRGRFDGGEGLRRDLRILDHTATVSLLSDRRQGQPYGVDGGEPGAPGEDYLLVEGAQSQRLPSKGTVQVSAGGLISIRTPGGGGHGRPSSRSARTDEVGREPHHTF